jgi:DNA polymerase-3 subunit alpha
MPHADFVHLHVHSQYSLLDGACQLEKLVALAQDVRMPALAVTDHGNLFGAVEFYSLAQKAGVKPIIGLEAYMAPSSRFERSREDGSYEGANHLTLLARDLAGYKNLIKLSSAAYLEGFYYKPRIDKELLAEHAGGLLGLSGCLNSEVLRALSAGDERRAREAAGFFAEVFGKGNFCLELQDQGIEGQRELNRRLIALGQALGLPCVATNDVHYLTAGDARAHEVLLCIQTGKTMQDRDRMRFSTEQFYFKSPAEMRALFAEVPGALKHTIAIAERCNLEIPFGQIHLPRSTVPEGFTLDRYLRHLAEEGLRRRYPNPAPEVRQRLEHELAVIERTGFAGYFLVVWDFISFAKQRGIPVGPGRGSAAGSLVAYCLGITNIDPLRYGLLFERFLNPERVSLPDMDIDFCYERRGEVIEYVTQKYGKDNVAQIITFGTLGAKAVIRDTGRALGMAYGEVDKIAKMVPATLNISLDEAIGQSPPLAEAIRNRPEVAELVQIARSLEGLTRHASTHAAGVVISSEPLLEQVPLYKGTKATDEVTTQYAMGSIEKIGLLKMDFLGLKTLTVISNTLHLIRQTTGEALSFESFPLDDPQTFQLLGEAKTLGVFQLESSGMKDLLRRLKPGRLEDIIALVALFRPGPMVMIDDFIARRHGRVKVTAEHPLMAEILKDTYGIMVYQEQVMRIAGELAGFSMGEADILRKAMGKKDPELMDKMRAKFLGGARARGIPERTAERIFALMAQFAGYGFNKSHAAAYALVAYQTAYLKAHYPVQFMAALLTSETADTDTVVKYIEECRQMGIPILPPDVNESQLAFTVAGDRIRFGLGAVKNVGETAIESILKAREERGKFRSLHEFCELVDLQKVNKRVIESLVKCGAFDSLGCRRAQLMAAIDQAMEAAARAQRDRARGQVSLFAALESRSGQRPRDPDLPDLPEWPRERSLAAEKEILGFYLSGHPLDAFRESLSRLGTQTTEELAGCRDKQTVQLAGIVTALKEITTKNGDRMAFVTLEDLVGTVEAIAFPDLYRASLLQLVKGATLLVEGQVDVGEEGVKLLLGQVKALEPPATNGKAPPSRVTLTIGDGRASAETLRALRDVVAGHPGPCPIRLIVEQAPGRRVTIAAEARVAASEAFVAAAEALLGLGSVEIGP